MSSTKECTKCGIIKKLSEYNKKGSTAQGIQKYRADCRDCSKAVVNNHYANNKHKYTERIANYKRTTKGRQVTHKYNKRIVKEMSDAYITHLLAKDTCMLEHKDITPELVELHRKSLTLKRKLNLTHYGKN